MSAPETPPDPLLGTLIDNRWRLLEQLGSDAERVVAYKAEPLKGGKPVALKLLDERCAASRELAARFDREARAISRVDHPHCVAILGFGIHQGRPFLVTPLLAGRRLSDELSKAPLASPRAARIVGQLLEGLRHGHAHGVIHRSLSPEKVLLVGNAGAPDQVKILDFGLARMLGGDEKRRVASGYLAPEQLQNGPVDQRADLYAVGVMLRAMVAAETVSPSLQRVIARAVATDPEQRFGDAGEMLAALEASVEGRAGLRRRAEHGPRAPLGRVVAMALLIAVGGSVWWLRGRADRARTTVAAAPASQTTTAKTPATTPSLAPAPAKPPTPTPTSGAAPAMPPVAAPSSPPAAAPASPAATAPKPPTIAAPSPPPVAASAPPPVAAPAPPPVAAHEPAPIAAPKPLPVAAAPPSPVAAAPPSAAAPATPTAPVAGDTPRARVDALLAAGRLDEAEALIRPQLAQHAEQAELHLELADVFFRRYWRNDTVAEWDRALALDPTVARDPRIATRLCAILGARWKDAGARLIERRLGRAALPALVTCVTTATDLARVQAAAALAERLGGKDAIDAQLLERRTRELGGKTSGAARE